MFQVVFRTIYTFIDIVKVQEKLLVQMSKNLFKMGIFTKILRNVSF